MKRFAVVFFVIFLSAVGHANAQVVESASVSKFAMTAGGFGSIFNPADSGNQYYPSGSNYLIGVGAYVDLRYSRWVQVEAEGRWLRFNEYNGENMDHYLIGPRLPIYRWDHADAYGKVLIGVGKMTFPYNYGHGSFTALAYGGGVDYRISRRLTIRAVDFELQQWPQWLPYSALYPWGVSAGVGYRLF